MSAVVIAGNTSGSVTLQAPNVAGSTTLNLPTVSGGTLVTSDSSGNVGIGTNSPTANLEIYGASSPYQITGNGVQKAFLGVDSGGGFSGSLSNHDFFLRTNNTNQVGVTTAGIFQFNSGYGSVAAAYGCRAWVNFNGMGTVAIRNSKNVSSITDNGTGLYTANFTNAMPDADYCPVVSLETDGNANVNHAVMGSPNGRLAGSYKMSAGYPNVNQDQIAIYLAVFR